MQIVIDIDDNEYLGIKNFPDNITSYPVTIHLYEAVKNGTPLPKGHGDLIDKGDVLHDIDCDEQMRLGKNVDWVREVIRKAPTIIEAESEESDDIEAMLEHLWNATEEDHRKYSEDMESEVEEWK